MKNKKKSGEFIILMAFICLAIFFIGYMLITMLFIILPDQDRIYSLSIENIGLKIQNAQLYETIKNAKCLAGTPINFDKIQDNDKEIILNYIQDLKLDYFNTVKSFFFTSNQGYLAELCDSNLTIVSGSFEIVSGCNQQGKILMWYGNYSGFVDDYDKTRIPTLQILLCHEILHNFINTGNYELDEKTVNDLAYYEVCYQNKNNVISKTMSKM